ncbi:hypothetical protein PUN28_017658 [Cardiocondyla obscurior]|uniref:Uncharacterized protein n=1 Tax=Cardiocondyla obscurior TaxID=286306 RepID=A0AAW2EMC7_9HYME
MQIYMANELGEKYALNKRCISFYVKSTEYCCKHFNNGCRKEIITIISLSSDLWNAPRYLDKPACARADSPYRRSSAVISGKSARVIACGTEDGLCPVPADDDDDDDDGDVDVDGDNPLLSGRRIANLHRISFRTRQNLGDSLAPDTYLPTYDNPAALFPSPLPPPPFAHRSPRAADMSRREESLPSPSFSAPCST